jgi:hypothetical protein
MSLAPMTTVAHANDQPAGTQAARRPPTPAAQANLQVRQTESSGQSSWLLPSLGVLVAALMLVGGLAVRAARRTRRRGRLEPAA